MSTNPAKRMRYCLSLRRPARAVIQQNIQVVPPVGYDEEGRLPKSLPPTPIIDLITEDEAEPERTPQREAPQIQMPQPLAPQPQPQAGPSLEELNPQDIERDVAENGTRSEDEFQAPPPLQPLRARGGKNLALLASVREPSPNLTESSDEESTVSRTIRSPSQSPPTSPVLGNGNVLLMVQEAQRRVDREKENLQRMVPDIRRRREAAEEESAALRRQLAALREQVATVERTIQNRELVVQQCDAELLSIENFCK